MRDSLFHVERLEAMTLQAQIREMLVSAVLAGQLAPGSPVPSTRSMAKRLNVSRNTVISAYQALADDGYLVPRERSGYYVSDQMPSRPDHVPEKTGEASSIDWRERLKLKPCEQDNIAKPKDWHSYPYPFIYGQVDHELFPMTAWRDCMRQAMGRKWLDAWTDDMFTEDDPMLVEQVRQRILTRRGVMAKPDEVLVTLGAQNALHIITQLILGPGRTLAIEDPGYPDMRNMAALSGARIVPVPVDGDGLDPARLPQADVVFTTPSHHFPTSVTMPINRRREMLRWADEYDAIIIEDDYEFETNYTGTPLPALKSLDRVGRVLYVGSLSKSLMPGIRLGFLVGPREFIDEARAFRRLALRHPPGNNQRATALFLALGHHDALIGRLHRTYSSRWQAMSQALDKHLPHWATRSNFGGTSFWLQGPTDFNSHDLSDKALEQGVVLEPGDIYHAASEAPTNTFRLGFSSIGTEKIEGGIKLLAETIETMQKDRSRDWL
ncbi:MAG: PLP-dependent aminotransferase family protein [Pseudomonadota bacterium]